MGRSDARLLKVPEGPRPQKPEETREAQPVPEQTVEPSPPPPSEVQPPVELTECPHCGARLSSLDIKTNHCFRCNAVLSSAAVPRDESAAGRFEVHI
jgi:hypothetical protein